MNNFLNKLAQFIFIILFVIIIVAQYFTDSWISKEIPLSVIIFIGSIAAGLRDFPTLLDKLQNGRKDNKK